MDLLTHSLPAIKLDALQSRGNNIISQLQQAGLFRALVTENQGNRVILDTAFGQLTGKAPDNLKKGDEILARLIPGKSEPTIKIEQHHPRLLSLNNKALSSLFKTGSSTALVAKVLSHSNDQTLLRVASKNYPIARQNLLQTGETLLLKPSSQQSLEVLRIQPKTILKNALSELLPRSLTNSDDTGFPGLQKTAAKLLQIKPESLPIKNQTEAQNPFKNETQQPFKTENPSLTTASTQKLPATKVLHQLLTNIANPLTKIDSFRAESVQQILTLLSFVKPPANQHRTPQFASYPDQLSALKQLLQKSPDSINQLTRDLIVSNTSTHKKLPSDSILLDVSNSFRAELLQQVEQTLTHLLIQKTAVRLQLEQNQPIQFNLNIPLQINNETTALKLKIREKQHNETTDEQHWEINLSFEFGLLGLISTHILLQGQKLSAHFWADKTSTKHLIDTQMGQFKTQLENSGFELGLFDCFIGQPAFEKDTPGAINENLVDIKV